MSFDFTEHGSTLCFFSVVSSTRGGSISLSFITNLKLLIISPSYFIFIFKIAEITDEKNTSNKLLLVLDDTAVSVF